MLPFISKGDGQQHALFEKANKLYNRAQYAEAIKIYKLSIAPDYQSGDVFYNMGNAYYRIGDIPSALLYYEKAHKLRPFDEDIAVNIQLANSKITDKISMAPEFFLSTWWHKFLFLFSVKTFSMLSVFCWISAAILLTIYLFAQSITKKKASFYTGISLFILGAASIIITEKQVNYLRSNQNAIIFSNSVQVRSEPSNSSKNLFTIHAGTKVGVIVLEQDWLEIKLPNGNKGWIAAAGAKII